MIHCTNSFPLRTSFFYLAFLVAIIAMAVLEAHPQTRSGDVSFQEVSLKAAKPCAVQSTGDVTWLVKNGVELSVTEDWDCDGIADAYDNCVGMANPTQVDSDFNWIGDACEAATLVKLAPAKIRSIAKAEKRRERSVDKHSRSLAEKRKAKAVDKRSLSIAEKRRSRPERTRGAEAKVRGRKPATRRKTKT